MTEETREEVLLHYTQDPTVIVPYRVEQVGTADHRSGWLKPSGLWVSVKGEYGWDEWCRDNDFRVEHLECTHRVWLRPNARILRLGSAHDLDRFTEEYGRPLFDEPMFARDTAIRWDRVAERYQGIIISPYIWERRMTTHTMWYYGWDCASGCIWDPAAIMQIALVDWVDKETEDAEQGEGVSAAGAGEA